MYVVKRNGVKAKVLFDKITDRNIELSEDLNVDTSSLSKTVIEGLKDGMTTREIDQLSYESANMKSIFEYDYAILASRIAFNDLHKTTPNMFGLCFTMLYNNKVLNGKGLYENKPLIDEKVYDFALENIDVIDKTIDIKRDYNYSFFAFKVLEESYFLRINGKIVERMQYLLMRVALGIHGPSTRNGIIHEGNIEKALNTYNMMSNLMFTHATPTLFYSGTPKPQMSSCFLLNCGDSIESIADNWKHTALISKHAGGIGVDITDIRGCGSQIGCHGTSDGIRPFIKILNEIARGINQGGKRKGAFAIYIQPWHPDVIEFLQLKLPTGIDEMRARDIHIALFLPDLFHTRFQSVKNNENVMWSLFCPKKYPELIRLHGREWEDRYLYLEESNKYEKQINIRELWEHIERSLKETGEPYMLDKDTINRLNNQKNIGVITGSNLCCEIVQYHDPNSVAVCNLSSISLPYFLKDGIYDFKGLGECVEVMVENMNYVIDKNFYPINEARNNNLAHRPIGLGAQGLADLFCMLRLPWESVCARKLNQIIFEVIYFHALKKSSELSKQFGSYSTFEGSPLNLGIFQWEMRVRDKVTPITSIFDKNIQFKYPILDWEWLRGEVKRGMRNSLLISPMPTVGTSQIIGNNDALEPFTSNCYLKKVLAGEYPLVNKYLYKDLQKLHLEKKIDIKDIVKKIYNNNGSVQNIKELSQEFKNIYKTVWEIPQKVIIDMAADRQAFIDQSQSLNIFLAHPTTKQLASMYAYSHSRELKTLSYYLRSKPSTNANNMQHFDEKLLNEEKNNKIKKDSYVCTDEICTSCSG